jgi:succinyl-diaminopimelate desuccinylase
MFEHQRELMLGDCLLSGEPSSPQCVRFGEKSPYWVAITVRTKGGHGAYTHSSASATKIGARIMKALEAVTEIPVRAPDNLVAMFRDPGIARQIDEGCGAGCRRHPRGHAEHRSHDRRLKTCCLGMPNRGRSACPSA